MIKTKPFLLCWEWCTLDHSIDNTHNQAFETWVRIVVKQHGCRFKSRCFCCSLELETKYLHAVSELVFVNWERIESVSVTWGRLTSCPRCPKCWTHAMENGWMELCSVPLALGAFNHYVPALQGWTDDIAYWAGWWDCMPWNFIESRAHF